MDQVDFKFVQLDHLIVGLKKKKGKSYHGNKKIYPRQRRQKVLSPFAHLGVKRCRNIQAARFVLGGKS